jgi:hypothetical protein
MYEAEVRLDQDLLDPDLAREFLDRPMGRHSPRLQALLLHMRSPGRFPDLLVVALEAHRRYVLAHRRPGRLPELRQDQEFPSLADAERAAFLERWRALGGTEVVRR